MKDRVTFIIKTFERPQCLNRLLYSIKILYPNIRIIVADDSKDPVKPKFNGVEHYPMEYDSGVSAGRNLALSKVETEYVVTLDDDFVFDNRTMLQPWIDILDNTEFDLVGGDVDQHPNYHSSLRIENKALVFSPEPVGILNGLNMWNIVLQFWMGRTDRIKEIGGWDSDFKTVDHMMFFARQIGNLKVAHTNEVGTGHMQIRDPNYYAHRNMRMQKYLMMMMDKLNIDRVIDRNGTTLYTYDGNTLR